MVLLADVFGLSGCLSSVWLCGLCFTIDRVRSSSLRSVAFSSSLLLSCSCRWPYSLCSIRTLPSPSSSTPLSTATPPKPSLVFENASPLVAPSPARNDKKDSFTTAYTNKHEPYSNFALDYFWVQKHANSISSILCMSTLPSFNCIILNIRHQHSTVEVSSTHQGCIYLNTVETVILWNISLQFKITVYCKNVIYWGDQSWIFSIISPVFSVTSSFRNLHYKYSFMKYNENRAVTTNQ